METKNSISSTDFIASIILVGLLSLILIFHFLVVVKIVPFEIIWGGRVKNYSQVLIFETISIFINLLMFFVVAINAGFVKFEIKRYLLNISLWIMFFLFLLNTIGNYTSINLFERCVLTPVTFIMALLSLKLCLKISKKIVMDFR